jgi:hypothetical protein
VIKSKVAAKMQHNPDNDGRFHRYLLGYRMNILRRHRPAGPIDTSPVRVPLLGTQAERLIFCSTVELFFPPSFQDNDFCMIILESSALFKSALLLRR